MSVCVLIPTLNEEDSIGDVIDGFIKEGFDNILVIDGNSTDRTREIAENKGAKVIIQSGKGKGQAVSEAFQILNDDIIVLIDGDGTYLPSEAKDLIKPIEKGTAEHVIGNRFARFEKGAFTRMNLIGNKILNFFFRLSYGIELHDILSGYRALKKEVYKNVELKKEGFEVETELTVESLARGFRIIEVPVTYKKREGKTKLNPIKDGFRIATTIYSLIKRYSPARYFYFIGLLLIFAGFLLGIYVTYEWFKRITHSLLAVLTALLIISGLQVFIFGVISDFVFKGNIETRREIMILRDEIRELKNEIKKQK